MYAEYGVPPEIEDGIVRLITSIAFPESTSQPFAVITRDSTLWFANYPDQQIKIYDVSPVMPASYRSSASEARILKRLLSNAKWPADRVQPSQRYFQAEGGRVRPDIVLLDSNHNPVAIANILNVRSFLGVPLQSAGALAETLGVRYAVLSNGRDVVVLDRKSDLAVRRSTFPGPEDLNPEAPVFDIEASYKASNNISITPIFGFPQLADVLANIEGTLLLDHTLPWGQEASEGLKPHLPDTLQKIRRMDLLAALTALGATSSSITTVVGILLPSVLSAPTYNKFRQFIVGLASVEAIVELPGELFRPYTTVRSTVLKLSTRHSQERKQAFFFSVSSRGDLLDLNSQPWYPEFLLGLQGKPSSTGFHSEIKPDLPWTFAAHRPDATESERLISRYLNMVPLGFLCEILPGCRHSREEAAKGKGLPVLRGRDISRGVRSIEELTIFKFTKAPPEQSHIRERDILVQRVGANPRSMVATRELDGSIASDTIIIFRPKSSEVDPLMIHDFLASAPGQNIMMSHVAGTAAPTLAIGLLHRIPIPQLDRSVTNDIRGLATMEQFLLTKLEKLRSLRTDIFSASTAQEFQERLSSVRQISRVVSESIHQAETLTFQIRNYYPYPLAYAYRLLAGITNPSDLYREQLRVAENILAFLGSLSLAIMQREGRANAGIDLATYWRSGISPGHWRDILRKTAATIATYKDHRLAQQIASLDRDRRKNAFRVALDKLIEAKNDFKHDRGPKTEEDFQTASKQISDLIERCMRDLSFLMEHPIRLVREMNVIRGTSVVTLTTLRCSGDHPGLAQEEIQYLTPLTRNDLYIEIETGRWASLYPFIVPHNCVQCKAREFYYIDKWQGPEEVAMIKSFERGHIEQRADIGEELGRW